MQRRESSLSKSAGRWRYNQERMTVLKIAGGAALSPFRLEKLNARVQAVQPDARVVAARFWHFVEVDRPLGPGEAATLEALLTYGAPAAGGEGREVVVTPRLGTISPWSSKATDIATHCGLGAIRRIERGTVYALEATGDLGPILPLLHDRMTEAVLGSLDEADELFHHFPPKPLTTIDVLAQGRGAIEDANQVFGLALAPDEIDYLVAYFTGRRSEPDRRRAHDVRAGELGTLPPQDLQRVVGRRRRTAAAFALRHDPHHARGQPPGHRERLLGQRRGDGRRDGAALLRGPRHRPVRLPGRRDPHPDEGGNAQSPDSHLAIPRGRHRLGRRESATRAQPAAGRSRRPACAGSRCRTSAFPASSARGRARSRSRSVSRRRSPS